jgi:long-chain acyl-CoA synthetase
MMAGHVDQVNRDLAAETDDGRMRRSQRFLVLHKELEADDGELTRTQKVRRGFIAERYAPLIDALYNGVDSSQFDRDRHDLRGRPQGHAIVAPPSKWRDAKRSYPVAHRAMPEAAE